jgi:hypothetical protein
MTGQPRPSAHFFEGRVLEVIVGLDRGDQTGELVVVDR